MKERPILFSGPMVRAILQNKKTQARRIVKPKPPDEAHPFSIICSSDEKDQGKWKFTKNKDHLSGTVLGPIACPYGKPGDRLWVKESFAIVPRAVLCWSTGVHHSLHPDNNRDAAIYREGWERSASDFGWRSSTHMPRWASRITLEITRIRVEKLQAINKADAIAEGIERVGGESSCHPWRNYLLKHHAHPTGHCSSPLQSYMTLWEKINGVGSWDANPWVWVVEFQRIKEVST